MSPFRAKPTTLSSTELGQIVLVIQATLQGIPVPTQLGPRRLNVLLVDADGREQLAYPTPSLNISPEGQPSTINPDAYLGYDPTIHQFIQDALAVSPEDLVQIAINLQRRRI